MRLPVQDSRRRALQFNITPLIDIVFLLIIFFLVASHFVRSDTLEAVDLPQASAANTDENPAHRLTITILADGRYAVSGEYLSREQILERITVLATAAKEQGDPPEVRIRADRTQTFGFVRPLLEQCARHEIRLIQFPVAVDTP